MARGGGLTNGQELGMFQDLGSDTPPSKGHTVGLVGFHAPSASTMNLTANSSRAVESLSLASSLGERMSCVCFIALGGKREGLAALTPLSGWARCLAKRHTTGTSFPKKIKVKREK